MYGGKGEAYLTTTSAARPSWFLFLSIGEPVGHYTVCAAGTQPTTNFFCQKKIIKSPALCIESKYIFIDRGGKRGKKEKGVVRLWINIFYIEFFAHVLRVWTDVIKNLEIALVPPFSLLVRLVTNKTSCCGPLFFNK